MTRYALETSRGQTWCVEIDRYSLLEYRARVLPPNGRANVASAWWNLRAETTEEQAIAQAQRVILEREPGYITRLDKLV